MLPALVVDVMLGFAERVQIAGEPVVAHRSEDRPRMVAVARVDSTARQPLDLLLEGEPGLRVLDHEDPREKKTSPRLAATG
ncbi:hypothetical protein [Tsukamurella soli]|uniref:hypothetical protein n=1 Tax=Tsukamurella soli TaxID=644556 RepID=UPI003617FA4B